MTPANPAAASGTTSAAAATSEDIAKFTEMANAIRALSMDAVQAANSGHPGLPMGAADVATVLFAHYLKFDPQAPNWADRDRFVLSAGHGSMLLYSLLHLLGYEDMTIEELKNFRQLGSRTAGHPEFGHASGIETTTGPLGQGLGNAVGMAIAEAHLAARFGSSIVDHKTYVLAGDGCLMEGISQEAISLAGHLKLNKLIVLWDDNQITIDGPVSLSDSTDQLGRFAASGWDVMRIDGHDYTEIAHALSSAQTATKPVLIACRTIIGYGSPAKQGTSGAHGAPLGADEIKAAREQLGWTHKPFEIPASIRDMWRITGLRGCRERKAWRDRVKDMPAGEKSEFDRRMAGTLPEDLHETILDYKQKLADAPAAVATRNASQSALEVINQVVPETIGGSADLTGSNNTRTKAMLPFTADDRSGRFIHWGIREHAMASAMNGMALHGGVIPYSGTFMVFTDYCRPAIRLSALMAQRVIYVMTHDSIGLGEDGPTHQPVEHLAALRVIPNLNVFRPCDAVETAECWELALQADTTPSILALTRQKLVPTRTKFKKENLCARGAYDVHSDDDAKVVIFASGSEVEIAMQASAKLAENKIASRVVSVPCMDLFHQQDSDYRKLITGDEPVRIAIEAGVRQGWDALIGIDGTFIGMSTFGASGPADQLYEHFGITADAAVQAVLSGLEASA
jgi:transketolase